MRKVMSASYLDVAVRRKTPRSLVVQAFEGAAQAREAER
jgi:hypothetical protein